MAAFVLVVFAAISQSKSSDAQPRDIAAKVLWVQADRIYVATADSGIVAVGDQLSFYDRRDFLATGDVVSVADGRLAVARRTSGSLARAKKLERLRVSAERIAPPPPPPMAGLRVGCPAASRSNLLFGCPWLTPVVTFRGHGYRVERNGRDGFRGVRLSPVDSGPSLPDTVWIRLFVDATDEEIALARGEIDVAVFWPGEGSRQMREDPRWGGPLFGVRARGVLVGTALGGDSLNAAPLAIDSTLAALNTQMFAGDLLPWSQLGMPPAAPALARGPYAADDALPGQRVLARFLARGQATGARAPRPRTRLSYLDADLDGRDALAAQWRARGITPLYVLRCPILCARERRAWVEQIGVEAFARIPGDCAPGRRP